MTRHCDVRDRAHNRDTHRRFFSTSWAALRPLNDAPRSLASWYLSSRSVREQPDFRQSRKCSHRVLPRPFLDTFTESARHCQQSGANLDSAYQLQSSTAKINVNVNEKDSLNGRFSFKRDSNGSFGPYHGLVAVDPGAGPSFPNAYNSVLNWTHTFDPNNLMELRASANRVWMAITSPNVGLSKNYDILLGLNVFPPSISNLSPSYPVMQIAGFTGLPQAFTLANAANNFEYTANFTMIRGRHA